MIQPDPYAFHRILLTGCSLFYCNIWCERFSKQQAVGNPCLTLFEAKHAAMLGPRSWKVGYRLKVRLKSEVGT